LDGKENICVFDHHLFSQKVTIEQQNMDYITKPPYQVVMVMIASPFLPKPQLSVKILVSTLTSKTIWPGFMTKVLELKSHQPILPLEKNIVLSVISKSTAQTNFYYGKIKSPSCQAAKSNLFVIE